MTNNTTADTTAKGEREGGVIEAVAWIDPRDLNCLSFEDGNLWPGVFRHWTGRHSEPLYSQAAIDTLRAQLEAAEADTSFATAAASIREWKARAEAAEADATRYVRLRSALYGDGLHVGEAVIQMDVIGQCPSTVDIDAAIDAAKAATP